jgi:hypothetical protein
MRSDWKVSSRKYRITVIASFAYGSLVVVGVTLLSRVYSIPTTFSFYIWSSGFVLMVAALISFISVKYGNYLYSFSAFFSLLRYSCADRQLLELPKEIPSITSAILGIATGPVGLTFVLSLLGVVMCRKEKKTSASGREEG